MGNYPRQILISFECHWQKGWGHAEIGLYHPGSSPPPGRNRLKQEAKDRHQVFTKLKKRCLSHIPCRGGSDGEQMCHLQLLLKMLIMKMESLIRVLKKEPYILWGVGCTQSSVFAWLFLQVITLGARLITWDSCLPCATLRVGAGGEPESWRWSLKSWSTAPSLNKGRSWGSEKSLSLVTAEWGSGLMSFMFLIHVPLPSCIKEDRVNYQFCSHRVCMWVYVWGKEKQVTRITQGLGSKWRCLSNY